MTSVVMFSNINEPLLLKLKERFSDLDLEWIVKQGKAVSDVQKNVVRGEQQDTARVHLMVFPHNYHALPRGTKDDPRFEAWFKETLIKKHTEHYMHDGVSLYVY